MTILPTPQELLQYAKKLADAFSIEEVIEEFGLVKNDRANMKRALTQLERMGQLEKLRGRFWRIPRERPKNLTTTGVLMISRQGTGFLRPHDPLPKSTGIEDVRVQEQDLATAMDGDEVEAECWYVPQMGWRGRVVRITKRARKEIIGQFQLVSKLRGIVTPRNPYLARRVSVPLPDPALRIENYDWVSVEVSDYTPMPQDLRGVVIERVGASHEDGIDVLLLLRDRGIISEFPAYVEHEAEALELGIDEALKNKNRVDLRQLPTATIDPATAKDFDDALSIQPLGDRRWKLYVHIADVAHYIKQGSFLDGEARERSTSVYPVDRVVPMLPEKLSNDLCSLRPHEDRLAMTAEMIVENDGRISSSRFYDSVIHSNHRFAYEEVQAIFEGNTEKAEGVPQEILDSLPHLLTASRLMRSRRFKNGALDLDIPESRLRLDADKKAIGFQLDSRFEAHKVVEDCMLAANEAVASYLTQRNIRFLYRVHEPADPDRLLQLRMTLKHLGVSLPVTEDGEISSFDLQKALKSIENREGGHILRRIMLRAMKRAEYSPFNQGHYGLASECYCHFTSPIRRYPDVIAHRQLKLLINNLPLQFRDDEESLQQLRELGRHTSFREREAADAERDSIRIKMMEFYESKIGEVFPGIISSIQGNGFFVELLDTGFDGFVSVRTLKDDHYEADEFGVALVGERSGRRFVLTQKVSVQLVRCDPFELRVDFELDEEAEQDLPTFKHIGGGRRKAPIASPYGKISKVPGSRKPPTGKHKKGRK
ncbi:MAG: ribonuclease R [Candidatus Sumerlaeia bacterium]|nr:ribonuclease R [Candidatus Sumerlaeia bacterium]